MPRDRARRLLGGFVLAAGSWCAAAAAQEESLPQLYLRGQPVYVRGQLLDEKARVVGIEEGDNGFRYRTPALERAARLSARVPRGELHRKRLAMYSPAATTFPGLGSRPTPVPGRGSEPRPHRLEPPASAPSPEDDTGSSPWPWVLALAFAAAALVVWRNRRSSFAHRA